MRRFFRKRPHKPKVSGSMREQALESIKRAENMVNEQHERNQFRTALAWCRIQIRGLNWHDKIGEDVVALAETSFELKPTETVRLFHALKKEFHDER